MTQCRRVSDTDVSVLGEGGGAHVGMGIRRTHVTV